ncbi:MAG: hypothetical protein ACTS6G_00345 [Candidatus Hodgkinia cicadicola]
MFRYYCNVHFESLDEHLIITAEYETLNEMCLVSTRTVDCVR